jgi:hypothetical protein
MNAAMLDTFDCYTPRCRYDLGHAEVFTSFPTVVRRP